jgi:hypothetical protein
MLIREGSGRSGRGLTLGMIPQSGEFTLKIHESFGEDRRFLDDIRNMHLPNSLLCKTRHCCVNTLSQMSLRSAPDAGYVLRFKAWHSFVPGKESSVSNDDSIDQGAHWRLRVTNRRSECTAQGKNSNADGGTRNPTVQSVAVSVTQLSKVTCKT